MTGPMRMFYDPAANREFVINVSWITHVYENKNDGGTPTCTLVLGIGRGLMLNVQGEITEIYRDLKEAVS